MSGAGVGAEELERIAARAFHMMGSGAEEAWTGDEAAAWEGMIEVNRRLRRDAEDVLAHGHGLSISQLAILGRLAGAADRTLRQTALAGAMGLSLSRVSRVIDALEARGLVERRTCPSDARAVNVTLTAAGGALGSAAQAELFRFVQARFFDHLEPDEVRVLARAFRRVLAAP